MTPGLYTSTETVSKLFTLRPQSRWRASKLLVRDSKDVVLFRLNHNTTQLGTGCKWTVHLPGGTDSKSVGSSDSSKSWSWKSGIGLSIENLAGDGKPITLKMRQPKGHLDPSYHILVDGQLFARVTKEKPGSRSIFPSWEVEIAKGFDMALVCCSLLRMRNERRPVLHEYHVDLPTGFRYRQDTGLAPVDQGCWQGTCKSS